MGALAVGVGALAVGVLAAAQPDCKSGEAPALQRAPT